MRRIIVITAIILAIVIAFDLYPGLRGGAGWQWAYLPPQSVIAVIALAVGAALYVVVMLVLRRRSVRDGLAWAVLGGTALAYLVVGTGGDPFFLLFTRTVSPVQTGASALQARIMARDGTLPTLQRWPDVMDEALSLNLIHFTTSPPGQPLLHQAAAGLFDAPALGGISAPVSRALRLYQCADEDVMRYTRGEIMSAGLFAYAMPLLATLAAIPLYLTARDLIGDRQLAVNVAGWWPLVPAVSMFAPTWNTLYPALCITAFWLLLRALMRRRLIWAVASGAVMAAATLLNFSVLPFLLLAGVFTLGWHLFYIPPHPLTPSPSRGEGEHEDGRIQLPSPRLRRAQRAPEFGRGTGGEGRYTTRLLFALGTGLAFAAGLLVPWLIFTLVTGVSPLDIARVAFGAHGDIVRRDYLPWLILHPYDVLLFTGLPASALAIWGAVRAIRRRALDPLALLTLSMAATFMLVNLAGVVQGENARILIFYMPFLLLMAATVLHDRERDYDAPLFGAQAVILVSMAAVLAVVPLDLNPLPTGPRTDIGGLGDVPWTDDGTTFTSAAYAGEFTLHRYRWVGDPAAQAITYEFEFGGITPTERPVQFELVARATTDEGEIVSEPFRWWPQGGEYPPTCWRMGETIRDTIVLPVPPVPHPVVWEVILRAVDERTGDVMHTPTGANALTLAPVRYP